MSPAAAVTATDAVIVRDISAVKKCLSMGRRSVHDIELPRDMLSREVVLSAKRLRQMNERRQIFVN